MARGSFSFFGFGRLDRRRVGALGVSVLLLLGGSGVARGADESLFTSAPRVAADAPEWRDLAAAFARQPDTLTDFEEQRIFPFRKAGVALRGEVRVSRERGLSLHYREPEERIVILDAQGMLVREAGGKKAPAMDPRAKAGVTPLLDILRFDFAALEKAFVVHGRRDGERWALALRSRDPAVTKAIGDIYVNGEGTAVRRIELHKSAKQRIEIILAPPRAPAPFSAEEVRAYFR